MTTRQCLLAPFFFGVLTFLSLPTFARWPIEKPLELPRPEVLLKTDDNSSALVFGTIRDAQDPDRPIPMDDITTVEQLIEYCRPSPRRLMDTLRDLRNRKETDRSGTCQYQKGLKEKLRLIIEALGRCGVPVDPKAIDASEDCPPKLKASMETKSGAVAAYTSDWQPGDEVSFSFSGIVYGPSGEKQTQEDYTGDFVGTVDSQGNKTEKPWSNVIRYKVAEGATSVTASLMKPDRTIITTANIPVHPKGTPLPIQLPPKISGDSVAYPVSQIGQPYTVYARNGGFSGDANKIKLRTRNKIDNATTESNAVAASPHSALFNPQVKEPGFYEYTVIDEGRFEDSFDVSAVGIKLDTSRAYRVNQKGTLAVIVALPPQAYAQRELFSENFQVTVEMETPNVLAFSNGQNPVVWSLQKSEVANNQARKEFSVRAGATGTFKVTARAKTPRGNNPDGEPPICTTIGKLDDLNALQRAKVVKLCQLAHEYVNAHDPSPGSYFFIGLDDYGEEYRGELDRDHVIWVHFKCHRYKCEN